MNPGTQDITKDPIFFQFAVIGAVWALLSAAASLYLGPSGSLGWTLGICSLSMLGIQALAKLFAAVMVIASAPQKQIVPIIRASYWGAIKLASLLLLSTVLLRHTGIPHSAILLGLGTLIVVPLLGGIWWSQRNLRHA